MANILIVDDDAFERVGLKSISLLNEKGFEIVGEAENGKEGLMMARKFSPDIIISDVKMPVMNGLELIQACRQEGIESAFILLSSYDDYDFVREAFKLGAVDYILKSHLNKDVLLEALMKVKANFSKKKIKKDDRKERLKDILLGRGGPKTAELWLPSCLGSLYLVSPIGRGWKKLEEAEIKRIEEPLKNLAEEIARSFPDCIGIPLDNLMTAYFIPFPISSLEEMSLKRNSEEFFRNVRRIYKYFLNVSAVMSCTSFVLDSDELFGFFTKAQEAIKEAVKQHKEITFDDSIKDEAEVFALIHDFTLSLDNAYDKGEDITESFRRLYQEAYERNLSCHSERLLLLLVRHILLSREVIEEDSISFSSLADLENCSIKGNITSTALYIQKAKKFIADNYNKPLSLLSVSEMIGVSPSYLSRKFYSITGERFVDYILRLRISKAKELLHNSNLKIYEVSEAVGFDNNTYFCYCFKKREGQTPQEYREETASR